MYPNASMYHIIYKISFWSELPLFHSRNPCWFFFNIINTKCVMLFLKKLVTVDISVTHMFHTNVWSVGLIRCMFSEHKTGFLYFTVIEGIINSLKNHKFLNVLGFIMWIQHSKTLNRNYLQVYFRIQWRIIWYKKNPEAAISISLTFNLTFMFNKLLSI